MSRPQHLPEDPGRAGCTGACPRCCPPTEGAVIAIAAALALVAVVFFALGYHLGPRRAGAQEVPAGQPAPIQGTGAPRPLALRGGGPDVGQPMSLEAQGLNAQDQALVQHPTCETLLATCEEGHMEVARAMRQANATSEACVASRRMLGDQLAGCLQHQPARWPWALGAGLLCLLLGMWWMLRCGGAVRLFGQEIFRCADGSHWRVRAITRGRLPERHRWLLSALLDVLRHARRGTTTLVLLLLLGGCRPERAGCPDLPRECHHDTRPAHRICAAAAMARGCCAGGWGTCATAQEIAEGRDSHEAFAVPLDERPKVCPTEAHSEHGWRAVRCCTADFEACEKLRASMLRALIEEDVRRGGQP